MKKKKFLALLTAVCTLTATAFSVPYVNDNVVYAAEENVQKNVSVDVPSDQELLPNEEGNPSWIQGKTMDCTIDEDEYELDINEIQVSEDDVVTIEEEEDGWYFYLNPDKIGTTVEITLVTDGKDYYIDSEYSWNLTVVDRYMDYGLDFGDMCLGQERTIDVVMDCRTYEQDGRRHYYDENDVICDFDYVSSNEEILSINEDGIVTAKKVGDAQIDVTGMITVYTDNGDPITVDIGTYTIGVEVKESYGIVEGTIYETVPGASFTAEDTDVAYMIYSQESPDGELMENASYKLQEGDYGDITVDKNGVATVSETVTEDGSETVLNVSVYNENGEYIDSAELHVVIRGFEWLVYASRDTLLPGETSAAIVKFWYSMYRDGEWVEYDENFEDLHLIDCTYESTNDNVLTVEENGEVTAVDIGEASVIVRGEPWFAPVDGVRRVAKFEQSVDFWVVEVYGAFVETDYYTEPGATFTIEDTDVEYRFLSIAHPEGELMQGGVCKIDDYVGETVTVKDGVVTISEDITEDCIISLPISVYDADNDNRYVDSGNLDVNVCVHEWDEGFVITEANCGKDGKMLYHCTKCGNSGEKSELIPATGEHKYVGAVTKEATTTETGVKTYTCSVCGDSYTEEIPKLKVVEESKEESKVEGTKADNKNAENTTSATTTVATKTGDNNMVAVWVGLIVVAAACEIGAIVLRRKRS